MRENDYLLAFTHHESGFELQPLSFVTSLETLKPAYRFIPVLEFPPIPTPLLSNWN
jgi:hypothetical protein